MILIYERELERLRNYFANNSLRMEERFSSFLLRQEGNEANNGNDLRELTEDWAEKIFGWFQRFFLSVFHSFSSLYPSYE